MPDEFSSGDLSYSTLNSVSNILLVIKSLILKSIIKSFFLLLFKSPKRSKVII
jgi:hypothetical protein